MRTPRPLGLSEKAIHYPKEQKQELILKEYIKEWIRNDYWYQGIRVDINTLAHILNTQPHTIKEQMILEAGRIEENIDYGGLTQQLGSIIQNLFHGTLADRASALQQHSILAVQQGSKYVPFLTGAVNQSLDNCFKANTQILHTLKAIMPSEGIEGLIKSLSATTTQGNDVMTASKAVELMKSQGNVPLLEAPDKIEGLEAKYNLGSLPEVRAHEQTGYDSSNEGLNFDKITELQAIGPDTDKHQDRRAHEIGEDLDADFIEN